MIVERSAYAFVLSSSEITEQERSRLLSTSSLTAEICRLRLKNDGLRDRNRKLKRRLNRSLTQIPAMLAAAAVLIACSAFSIWRPR